MPSCFIVKNGSNSRSTRSDGIPVRDARGEDAARPALLFEHEKTPARHRGFCAVRG